MANPDEMFEVVRGRPWRDLGDRIVVFDHSSGVETVISGAGTLVWRVIAPRRRVVDVTNDLTTIVEGDGSRLSEALGFIDRLIEQGLISRG